MVTIAPFVGTRYNSQLIQDLKSVVAPPSDSISKEEQKLFHQLHPNNVVRLILGYAKPSDDEYSNKFTRAANYLQTWKRDGILVEDDKKSFYIYEQRFTLPDGKEKVRMGIFGLVKLEDCKKGGIRSQEKTHSKIKQDSLKLMRATKSNLFPILLLFSDPESKIDPILSERMSTKPWLEVIDFNNVLHRLWVVNKKNNINDIIKALEEKNTFIADGYQKYETALTYQKEMREDTGLTDGNQPFDYMMVYLTTFEDPGLVILPTHRVLSNELGSNIDINEIVKELKENFSVNTIKIDPNNIRNSTQKIIRDLDEKGKENTCFGMVIPNYRAYIISLKKDVSTSELIDLPVSDEVKKLDVTILHHHIISQVWVGNPEYEIEEEDILYVKDAEEAISLVQNKKRCVAFLMNPVKLEQIKAIANKGEIMPQKSTYFYPKLLSGLVMRDMSVKK